MSNPGDNQSDSLQWDGHYKRRGTECREFFMKAEVFAATKQAVLEDQVSPSWAGKTELTDKEEELFWQDDEIFHHNVMQRWCICNHQIAWDGVWNVSSAEGPLCLKEDRGLGEGDHKVREASATWSWIWMIHTSGSWRWSDRFGGSKNVKMEWGTVMSRWKWLFRWDCPNEGMNLKLLCKIGMKDFTHKEFISKILGHYDMFVDPFKNWQARKNQDGQDKEKG